MGEQILPRSSYFVLQCLQFLKLSQVSDSGGIQTLNFGDFNYRFFMRCYQFFSVISYDNFINEIKRNLDWLVFLVINSNEKSMPFELKCSILTNFGMPISGKGEGRRRRWLFCHLSPNILVLSISILRDLEGISMPIQVAFSYQFQWYPSTNIWCWSNPIFWRT